MPSAAQTDAASATVGQPDSTVPLKIQGRLRQYFPRDLAVDFQMIPGALEGNTLTVVIVKGAKTRELIEAKVDYIAERVWTLDQDFWPERAKLKVLVSPFRMSSDFFTRVLQECPEDPMWAKPKMPTGIDALENIVRPIVDVDPATSPVSNTTVVEQVSVPRSIGSGRPIYLEVESDDSPTHKVIKSILNEALGPDTDVSDIHIEPGRHPTSGEFGFRVRFRELNDLRIVKWLPDKQGTAMVSALSHHVEGGTIDFTQLDREIQDGRITIIDRSGERIPVRANTMPVEASGRACVGVVLRILRTKSAPTFDRIGFDPEAEKEVLRAIHAPYGVVLVVGPTSSGKTTTLYSCLGELNTDNRKLCTIEEPPEYAMPGAEQVHAISTNPNRTFAKVLRGMMRRNPNVILVGEIRDKETADAAIDASITGHVVFSTLHTHDTASTLTRLSRMGIPPYQLESQMRLVIAQRLLRRINPEHYEMRDLEVDLVNREYGLRLADSGNGKVTIPVMKPDAPADPKELYSGRFMIYELLPVTPTIGSALARFGDKAESVVRKRARKSGLETLFECGLKHVLAGRATLEDLVSVTRQ